MSLVAMLEVAVVLLGEIEVAVRLAADQDRHPQERVHRRVVERKAVRLRVLADSVETQRMRLGDQDAEDAVPAWKVADGGVGGLVDSDGEETLELLAPVVENPEGGVSGARQLACDVEHPIQQAVDVELGDEGLAHVEEAAKTLLSEDRLARLVSQLHTPPGRVCSTLPVVSLATG
jgi:hypothetical protein